MRRFGVRSWRLLCFPLAFGLAACGSEGSDDGPPARGATAPTAEPEPPPPAEEPVAPSAPVEVTIAGVTPVAATAASSLGSGDPLGFPAAPSREAPIRLSVADGTSAMIVDGAALVWGDHHEHVPYRVEHSGPVRVAGVDDAIQVVAVAGGVSVLRSDGSVVEAAAGDDGAELTRPRAPPLALLRREPGGQASCGISRRGGEVHCWGGFGAPEGRARRIPGITNARALALRDGIGAAVVSDGTVRTFGEGGASDFGTGADDDSYDDDRVATPIGLTEAVDVVATSWSFCALRRDGTAWCWGEQVGGDGDYVAAPAALPGLDGAISLHAGERLVCARRRDGSVACVGEGLPGLPTPSAGVTHATPVDAPMARGAAELAISSGHACWLGAEGPPRCVGKNDVGQLGEVPRRTVVPSVPGVRQALWVSAWGHRSCAGGASGIWCWGSDAGDLAREAPRPVAIEHPEDIRAAWIGPRDACVLRRGAAAETGSRECFADVHATPRSVGRIERVARIAGPCAEMEDGRVRCGLDEGSAVELPDGPHRGLAASARYGHVYVCAMRAAGDHATCGQLRFGDDGRPSLESVSALAVTAEQLALSTPPCARTGAEVRCYPSGRAPSVVAGAFEELGAGTLACGRSGGNVSCWGYVDVPQLLHISGVPHPDATDRPTRIAGITDATALAVGDDHGCALRATGEVACFGDTRSGGVGALPGWVRVEPVLAALAR